MDNRPCLSAGDHDADPIWDAPGDSVNEGWVIMQWRGCLTPTSHSKSITTIVLATNLLFVRMPANLALMVLMRHAYEYVSYNYTSHSTA